MVRPRKRIAIGILTTATASVALSGCSNRGLINYRPSTETTRVQPTDRSEIDVRFSTLDRVTPFHTQFPTGLSIEAPNLDPRVFAPPAHLVRQYVGVFPGTDSLNAMMVMPPEGSFEPLGAVVVDLRTPDSQNAPPPFSDLLAPNGKLFQLPVRKDQYWLPISWGSPFAKLRQNAAQMGADAVIEVFCAKGVREFFVAPGFVPVPGFTDILLPGGPTTSDWELIGLAVRWKKGTDAREIAPAKPVATGDSP